MARGKKIGAFALSEPDVGSDAQRVKTAYRKKPQGYVITGKKKWISFGEIADFFLVVASQDKNVSVFIVERDSQSVRTRPIPNLLASRATSVAELEFDDTVIPEENMLGKEGSGFPYIVGTALDHGRYSISWGGVAVAQASLEAMVNYARRREQVVTIYV